MQVDLSYSLLSLSTGKPLPFAGEDGHPRDMTLRDALVQICEIDQGPQRDQRGMQAGPSRLQAYRLGLQVIDSNGMLELSRNDMDMLKQIVERSGMLAIVAGQALQLLEEAEAADKTTGKKGDPK